MLHCSTSGIATSNGTVFIVSLKLIGSAIQFELMFLTLTCNSKVCVEGLFGSYDAFGVFVNVVGVVIPVVVGDAASVAFRK